MKTFQGQFWRFAWGYDGLIGSLPIAVTFHRRSHYRRVSRRWNLWLRTKGPAV
jgi:hypothetical protein